MQLESEVLMLSARERAFKVWNEIDKQRDPVAFIENALKEQNKLTQEAISNALIDEEEDSIVETKKFRCLPVETIHNIVMGTSAV